MSCLEIIAKLDPKETEELLPIARRGFRCWKNLPCSTILMGRDDLAPLCVADYSGHLLVHRCLTVTEMSEAASKQLLIALLKIEQSRRVGALS